MALRRLALVFPGQGSQHVGMGKDLLNDWPRIVGDVLEEASEATGLSLRRRMTEGPADELTPTHVAQPALLSLSVAVLRVLQHEMELPRVQFALGHSLGEYSALVAAGAIDFAEAARLVHFRGLAMQRAVAPGVGAMAALMPVQPQDAELLCREAVASTGKACQVANYNSHKQTVVSGDAEAVTAVVSRAKTTGKARRAVLLDVSAPFHCDLMEPAKRELREYLEQLLEDDKLRTPEVPVVWNVEAAATIKMPEEIAQVLEKQLVHAVRWSDSVDYCVDQGVTHFLELGVGGVLSGLIRQQTRKSDLRITSCGTTDEVKTFLNEQHQSMEER
uniref:[acyl-carrier-protein] S-malonyltransferase n=1 Tax=Peronospora matthiolae TaxID=2874970 RepID=A0AAV1U969_9STRA